MKWLSVLVTRMKISDMQHCFKSSLYVFRLCNEKMRHTLAIPYTSASQNNNFISYKN
jgi:hypothetical protein